ncbi:MAG TPA: hypothetical protein VF974_07430 [Patescibacteria group bacterium]
MSKNEEEKPICDKCGELLHSGKCEDVTSLSIEYEDGEYEKLS